MTANGTSEQADIIEPTALEAVTRGEIDIQIATARRWPRSMTEFRARAISLATVDEGVAGDCEYLLKRREKGGKVKVIRGPTIRLAEIVAASYGNIRCAARVVSVGERQVTAQAVCHDLETNTAMSVDSSRRITTRDGRRYGDDMIITTQNAACSIALRNAIFRVVPVSLCKPIIDAAKEVAAGDAKTLPERREACVKFLREQNVSDERIAAAVDRRRIEDLDLQNVADLRAMVAAIRDGATSYNEAFPAVGADLNAKNGTKAKMGFPDKATEPQTPGPEVAKPEPNNAPSPPADGYSEGAPITDEAGNVL